MSIGQSQLGQALPRRMHVTHDGGSLICDFFLMCVFFPLWVLKNKSNKEESQDLGKSDW